MDEMREFDNGRLAGLPYDEAKRLYPTIPDLPAHASAYGQESALAFRFRLENAQSRIHSENEKDATLGIVSHDGAIFQLYRAFWGCRVLRPSFLPRAIRACTAGNGMAAVSGCYLPTA